MNEFEKHEQDLIDADIDLREVEQEIYAVMEMFEKMTQASVLPETGFEDVIHHETRLARAVIRNVFREYMETPIRKIHELEDFCSEAEVAKLSRSETNNGSKIRINVNLRVLCLTSILKVAVRNLLQAEDELETGARERIREEMKSAGVETSEETWLAGQLEESLGWNSHRS